MKKKLKKALRYLISAPCYLNFVVIKTLMYVQRKMEVAAAKRMLKWKLIEKYEKTVL